MKYILLIYTTFLIACGNKPTEQASDSTVHANAKDTIVTNAQPMVIAGCYEMTMKRDTAALRLDVQDTIVTGKLNYHFYEKDWNGGDIKGIIRDNLIHADYTFRSEGMTSVREVVFKIQDDALWQGFGDLTEKNGKIIFVNKQNLQFHSINPFIKVNCE
ncbi:MAG: hypothetical protein ABR502_02140 [Chitinophagaceae bacterium]